MIFNINNKLSDKAINEVYFGKTPQIQAAEKQLDIFRNKYMNSYVFNTHVNSDADLLKFDRIMEDIFGLGCFSLHVINQAVANAFTMPIDYRWDNSDPLGAIVADKNGFKFKKERDYSILVCIYSGIIFNPDFTTEEVMACILHEVGHNFTASLSGTNGALINTWRAIMAVSKLLGLLLGGLLDPELVTNSNSWRNFADRTGKRLREDNSFIIIIYDIIKQIYAVEQALLTGSNRLIHVVTLGLSSSIFAILNCVTGLFNITSSIITAILIFFKLKVAYRDEETADNFATMYGYGSAAASLTLKFNDKPSNSSSVIMKTVDKIPLISTLIHFNELPAHIILTALDEHPEGILRAKEQLKMLKREVEKEDIDPKMRKVILNDIKECEKQIEIYTRKTSIIEDPYAAKKAYNRFISNISTDIKQNYAGNRARFDEYDDTYERVKI